MSQKLRTAIKDAITKYSSKYNAKKVYGVHERETALGDITIFIEVKVKRKPKKRTYKKSLLSKINPTK